MGSARPAVRRPREHPRPADPGRGTLTRLRPNTRTRWPRTARGPPSLFRRALVPPGVIPSPKTGRALVDEYFIENRNRLLEIAAFLDRLDRADGSLADHDFRVRAFREALRLLDAPPAAGEDRKS